MAQRKRKRLLCAWVSYLCLESKRINVSLRAQFFLQLWCQGLSTFIAASVVNLNALFVSLNLQINPLLMHYMQRTYTHTHTHTHNTEAQLGRDVTCLPKSFSFSSRCFEQHLSVPLLSFYPLAPRFFPMILLWTPPHAKLPSPLGATSVPLCMVAGLKL